MNSYSLSRKIVLVAICLLSTVLMYAALLTMPLDVEDTQLDFEQTNLVGTSPSSQDIRLLKLAEVGTIIADDGVD